MQPLIAGNWKMHGSSPQLADVDMIAAAVAATPVMADVLLCLPATLVARAAKTAAGRIAIGGENCAASGDGAFTGDISAAMLRDAGATAVILGHSERRSQHHETDDVVAAKVRMAWRSGLSVIVCIGETKTQRNVGSALSVCAEQLAGSLPADADTLGEASIAYEPLWAIGTGQLPTRHEIEEVHLHIRSRLTALLGARGQRIRILYGGSIRADNAATVLAAAEVGGLLIGGASLHAADFDAVLQVVRQRNPQFAAA
jgi:triosephosphate isomerase